MKKIKPYKQFFNEAFASSQVQMAVIKMCNILSRRIGKKISVGLVPMTVLKGTGERLSGLPATFGDKQIRFNWDTHDRSSNILSIDYWTKVKKNPDYTLYVGEYNVIQILDAVVEFIKNPEVGEILAEAEKPKKFHPDVQKSIKAFFDDMDLTEKDLANRRVTELYNKYLFWYRETEGSVGYKEVSSGTFRSFVIAYLEKYGMKNIFMKSVKVVQAGKEKYVVTDQVEAKKFDKEIYNFTLQDKVDFAKQMTRMVVQGLQNCLLVGGTAGVGKSTLVREVMNDVKGMPVEYIKGNIKDPEEYYKFLYRTNGSIIVIDDTDEVLGSKFLGLQKAALDSQKVRKITFHSKNINDDESTEPLSRDEIIAMTRKPKERRKTIKYPTSFDLTSRFVIITNMPKKKINSAILSRGIYIEFTLNIDEIIDAIRVNLDYLFPEYSGILTHDMKEDVIDWIEEHKSEITQIDYRLFQTVCALRAIDPVDNYWKIKAKFALTAMK